MKKLAFILTDGQQNPKGDISLSEAAGKLINDDIKTICIGVGPLVSTEISHNCLAFFTSSNC